MGQFTATALSFLTSVAMLVIISIGLAVIFGMMGVINLAHGEFIMLGAFMTLLGTRLGLNIWLAMLFGSVAVGVFGIIVEVAIIRFLYGDLAATMLATWGLGLVMAQSAVLIFGSSPTGIKSPLGNFTVGNYSVSTYNVFLIVAAIVLLTVVYLVFTKSRYGVKARAVNYDSKTAAALGIDARKVSMLTFGFGSALAGAAGALLAPITAVVPNMGQALVGKAFMTVVVGGPGVLSGTASASTLLGGVDSIFSNIFSPVLGTAALLVIAIVLLRLLPTGISGKLGKKL